ncbi:RnfABCDGE type electron transport complex subunit G [candidate division KSB1 bacterium]|nr:RnfABCDGE type electron transport complex subunit G [candidate division KSB1 bacterium]RQV99783.1 MAG: RnfABCDGE type electron transport complex subunit G [candidate division KSB1 bacterium]
MNDILKLGGLLMLITVIAATALAGIYNVTKPRIEAQKALELERALTVALPDAPQEAIFPVQQNDKVAYYIGYKTPDKQDTVGYAFVARGSGYSSVIETMVGVDSAGQILGIKVLSQVETPGLGTKVEEVKYGEQDPWFTRQFLNKSADQLAVDKDGGDIQSITGATISSRALTNSVVQGYQKLLKDNLTQK